MPPTIRSTEGPANDMIWAINHYISTGDRLGEGTAMEDDIGDYVFVISYDPKNPDDFADYGRFKRRIAEIVAARRNLRICLVDTGDKQGRFLNAFLHVCPADLRRLAAELVRSCGEAGWGTPKAVIDKHLPGLREKILSGEGV